MKINSISSVNYNQKGTSFKHTAVPYPEYENAYANRQSGGLSLREIKEKVQALFSPKVTKEAINIKSGIDSLYDDTVQTSNPKSELLSVLA